METANTIDTHSGSNLTSSITLIDTRYFYSQLMDGTLHTTFAPEWWQHKPPIDETRTVAKTTLYAIPGYDLVIYRIVKPYYHMDYYEDASTVDANHPIPVVKRRNNRTYRINYKLWLDCTLWHTGTDYMKKFTEDWDYCIDLWKEGLTLPENNPSVARMKHFWKVWDAIDAANFKIITEDYSSLSLARSRGIKMLVGEIKQCDRMYADSLAQDIRKFKEVMDILKEANTQYSRVKAAQELAEAQARNSEELMPKLEEIIQSSDDEEDSVEIRVVNTLAISASNKRSGQVIVIEDPIEVQPVVKKARAGHIPLDRFHTPNVPPRSPADVARESLVNRIRRHQLDLNKP